MMLPIDSRFSHARLRPGRTAQVLNISQSGALIETDWRVVPGMRVDVQIGEAVPPFSMAGRVLRCHVALLERSRVRYRAALAFDHQLPGWEITTLTPTSNRTGRGCPTGSEHHEK
jgi:hypothetical protein